jgi:hypothetical protein
MKKSIKISIPRTNYTGISTKKKGVVMHWMAGWLNSADIRFKKLFSGASAHYGIGEHEIHQYVEDQHVAYHAGNWNANTQYIGIEHEGGWLLDDGSRAKPSPKVHEQSAELLAVLSKKHGWGELKRNVNVFVHNQFKATMCPGTLDVDLIIKKANELLNNKVKTMTRDDVIDHVRSILRNDFETDPKKGVHINVDHWLNVYNKKGYKEFSDGIFQNICGYQMEKGLPFLNATTVSWSNRRVSENCAEMVAKAKADTRELTLKEMREKLQKLLEKF